MAYVKITNFAIKDSTNDVIRGTEHDDEYNAIEASFTAQPSATQTLTNKTIALGSNTVSGTTAQFNTALTDGDFATLAGTETLTNKALNGSLGATTPSTVVATTISASGGVDKLTTATGVVSVSAATAPSVGQVLQATSATVATWQTLSTVSVGGSNTQLQYNNSSALGGISGVTTDGTRITNATTMSVGGATPSASGAGITFPATQSASTDANTLDDYEEGTFTGTFTCGAGTITLSASFNTGSYTKWGRLVNITGEFRVSSVSTPSGACSFNLPYPVANSPTQRSNYSNSSFYLEAGSQNMNTYFINCIPTTSQFNVYKIGTTSFTNAADAFSGDEVFFLSLSYLTD